MSTDVLSETKYSIFVPVDIHNSIRKSEESENHDWYVQGYATTPDLDLQGDIVLPEGIDYSYFTTKGWINYEHKQDAEYVIGVPTENCYVDMKKGLFVEAKLMQDNPHAQAMWNLANSIEKSGIHRQLGFSIEGFVTRRSSQDNRVIEGVKITNVALTKSPANPNATWDKLVKSWTTGYDTNPETQADAGALRRKQFDEDITNLTGAIKTVAKWCDMPSKEKEFVVQEVAKSLEEESTSQNIGAIVLQLSRGVSLTEAINFIESRKETN